MRERNVKLNHLKVYGIVTGLLIIGIYQESLTAQDLPDFQQLIEQEIERIIDDHEDETSDSIREQMIADLYNLHENPLDLNSASAARLSEIPGLTPVMISAIIKFRSSVKPFESVDELLKIYGIEPENLQRIRPFVTIAEENPKKYRGLLKPGKWFQNGRGNLITRYRQILQNQQGYSLADSLGGYLGSPVNFYQRFQYQSDHTSLNLTQQKSPGEKLQTPLAFKNRTWHVLLHNIGHLQMLVAGHYNLRLGNGLLLNNRPVFGKGRNVTGSLSNPGPSFRGYTSAQAAGSLNGTAVSLGNRLNITAFYSNKKRSATEVSGDTIRFPASAMTYNTSNLLDRKDNTRQITYGGGARYQSGRFTVGFNAFENRFNRPVESGSQPYQHYAFRGIQANGYSLDYSFQSSRLTMLGEAAQTGNRSAGFFSAFLFSPAPDTDIAISWRQYDPGFQGIFGAAFSEQSGSPRNERGLYMALKHQLTEKLKLSGFIDHFRFPAPRFQTNRPSRGIDWFASLEFQPDAATTIDLSYRQKTREEQYRSYDLFQRENEYFSFRDRKVTRIHLTHQASRSLRVRLRAEWVHATPPGSETESGYLFFKDIRWQPFSRIQVDTRYTFFETDGFEARLYHFENDLLYLFSSTMLFDQGQRMYLLLNCRITDAVQIWFKIATTVYENRNEIGSGLNRIAGNRRSDIGLQARVRF